MPQWQSNNGRGRLWVGAQNMSLRFSKAAGECSYQVVNGMLVYEDRAAGERRILIGEQFVVSEDDEYVYFTARGRLVEQTESLPVAGRTAVGPRRGQETGNVSNG
jgi:hypothetical protein